MTEWKNKTALVTGASSGIGEATVCKLASHGLRVGLVARRADRLEQVAGRIRQAGGEALPLAADLSDETECARVFEQAVAAWGAVDVLVNNAGLGWYGFGEDMAWTLARQMLQVNVAAVVRLTLLCLPGMKARNSGHIINVGSMVGSLPTQGIALYSATKSFVDTFTASLHRELRGSNVRVSVVKPGPVATEFFDTAASLSNGWRVPAEKWGVKPQAVADRIWALLQRPNKSAYVPGVLALVPWLELCFGWLIDWAGPLALKRQAAAQTGQTPIT